MIWNVKDYLPDFQGALTGFYEESLKNTVETKTQEFKSLLEKNIAYGQKTQHWRTKTIPKMVNGVHQLWVVRLPGGYSNLCDRAESWDECNARHDPATLERVASA